MKTPAILLALLVLAAGCSRGPKTCPVCQRDECTGLAFRVALASGKRVETCCPRCGLHYLRSTRQSARSIEATDLSTGRWIDATRAVFVEDSDVAACAAMETRRDAQGCCYVKGFDRCLPSLVAFASADAARAFQQQHGGRIVAFDSLANAPRLTTRAAPEQPPSPAP